MAFRFRFKSLLQKREYSLREAQSAFALAHRRWEESRQRLQSARSNYHDSWQDWQEKQHRGVDARYCREHIHFLKSLEQQLLFLESELNEARKEMERRKSTMLDRDKEARIMEELQEKDRRSYKIALHQKEQKQLDEIAVFKDFRCRSL
ncbi:MAG: flagellar export protein FliJ [Deltaproteobacteria bacterium]|nr:flagellar export protein FliJ [Deltaproteobacteria bacterium]